MYDQELIHYGVLGMRWGHRKGKTSSQDYNKAKAIDKKSISEMSNEELKTVNNRLNLESNYRDLKRKNVSRGRKIVGEILETSAKVAIGGIITVYAKQGIEALLKMGIGAGKSK